MAPAATQKDDQHLKVDNPRMFPPDSRPYAILNGQSVRIVGEGNIEGKSPCFRYVSADSLKMLWESQGQFTIIDPAFLPASEQALQVLGQTLVDTNKQPRR